MQRRRNHFQPQLRVKTHHIAEADPLVVTRISTFDMARFWCPHHPTKKVEKDSAYYITCNSAGEVNYEGAAVFTSKQLVGRNNVTQVLQ